MKATKYSITILGRVIDSMLFRGDEIKDAEVQEKIKHIDEACRNPDPRKLAQARKEEVDALVQLGVFTLDEPGNMTHSALFTSIERARKEMDEFMKEVTDDGTVAEWTRKGDAAEGFKDGKLTYRIALWTEEVYS